MSEKIKSSSKDDEALADGLAEVAKAIADQHYKNTPEELEYDFGEDIKKVVTKENSIDDMFEILRHRQDKDVDVVSKMLEQKFNIKNLDIKTRVLIRNFSFAMMEVTRLYEIKQGSSGCADKAWSHVLKDIEQQIEERREVEKQIEARKVKEAEQDEKQ